jgi:NADH dehydrogenase [ubiquinone] 1 alpha subcomplex assembly factor 5
VVDEEALLTHIDEDSQEAIVSNLGLHWVNDIPGESRSLVFFCPVLSTVTSYSTEADVGDVMKLQFAFAGHIVGVLKQIRQGLKPDGFFLGSMLGGDSVFELR